MIKKIALLGAACGLLAWSGSAMAAAPVAADRDVQSLALAIGKAAAEAEARVAAHIAEVAKAERVDVTVGLTFADELLSLSVVPNTRPNPSYS
mgnify:CR=1 FL=1